MRVISNQNFRLWKELREGVEQYFPCSARLKFEKYQTYSFVNLIYVYKSLKILMNTFQ